MSQGHTCWCPVQLVLRERSSEPSPDSIATALNWVRGKLPWFPPWFEAENLQDCVCFMIGSLSAPELRGGLVNREMAAGPQGAVYWEVIEASDRSRRVFFAPMGTHGIPGPRGALNIHFEPEPSSGEGEPSGYQRLVLSVFEPFDAQ